MKGDKKLFDIVNRNHDLRVLTDKLNAISAGRRPSKKRWFRKCK